MADSSKRIILIDDEPGVVLALKLVLQTLGFNVDSFTNPQLALDHLPSVSEQGNCYILCDLRMPVLSGFDVLAKCGDICPALPVIIMSGHAEEDEKLKAISLGAKAFLSKPFSPEELLGLIASL